MSEPEKEELISDQKSLGSDEIRYVCSVCFLRVGRREHYNRHMLIHTGEKPHSCLDPTCNRIFSRSDNMNQHYRDVHLKVKNNTRTRSRSKVVPAKPVQRSSLNDLIQVAENQILPPISEIFKIDIPPDPTLPPLRNISPEFESI